MPKILLAEDDRTMISLLTTLLKLEGFEVVALDAQTDIPAAVSRERPDAMLMDVHLGGQNGMEIVETLRRDPANARINIVMTSGLNTRDECLQCGANDFILKPFMPDDLLKLLKK